MQPPFSLLLATSNRGKVAELVALFGDVGLTLVSLSSLPGKHPSPIEDGATFLANALLKANAAAQRTGMVTIAEDSGLEVDALGKRPGVHSARFAREGATDAENNARLLSEMEEVIDDQRAARFRCTMVLVDPWSAGEPIVTEGRCEGTILRAARGSGGFGYDPLFLVDEEGVTMAELGEFRKNQKSHRALAARAMRPHLLALVEARSREAITTLRGGT